MSVKVTFEFDTEGLPAYENPKDPQCLTNISQLFRSILLHSVDAKSDAVFRMAPNYDPKDPYLKACDEDIELAKRILRSMKIEIPGCMN